MKISHHTKRALKELVNLSNALGLYYIEPRDRSHKMFYKLFKVYKNITIELFTGFEKEWLGTLSLDIQVKPQIRFGFILIGLQFELSIFKEREDIIQ